MCVVTVEELTKIYKLYNKPSERLKELILHKPFHKEFIALNSVSFSLQKGESFGVIGDNGAGKSTLLKILSKTLSPTSGRFEVKGLVSSMLELGSGFHPEFTGIENIYLYGSLIGISHELMKKKTDEIIDFSELGDFIRYPIKTYSSGMHVRLAFSVATVVNPDILIIDEALSVGDQYFQRKCLDKMADFKKRNKTIIFCSHDLYPIKIYCEKALWLDHGKIKMLGKADDVANAYADYERERSEKFRTDSSQSRVENGQLNSFIFVEQLRARQDGNTSLIIEFVVKASEAFTGHIGWSIVRRDMLQISFTTTHMQGKEPVLFNRPRKVRIRIDNINIVNDTYFIYVAIFDSEALKPLAVDSVEYSLTTGYKIHNALCHFKETISLE